MDEQEIQTKLAENIPKTSPDPQPHYPSPPPSDDDLGNLPLENSITRNEIMDYFNINNKFRQLDETKTQVDAIMQWARETSGSNDLVDLFQTIRRQEGIMGIRFTSDRVERLYRHIRLDREMAALTEKQRALYG